MIPYVSDKYASESINKPEDLIDESVSRERIPSKVVIIYQSEFYDDVVRKQGDESFELCRGEMTVFNDLDVGVFSEFQIGAAMTVSAVEKLIHLGVDTFVNLGWAGGLDEDHGPGSVVLSEGAIRDEGVSYHYLQGSEKARPSEELVDELRRGLSEQSVVFDSGVTWTTDAPHRETKRELEVMREEGVLAVDMELSAVLAVARFRGVHAAGVFCISDVLSHGGWEQHFEHGDTRDTMIMLFDVVLDVLEQY
jgi:uridine phosphorylase